MELSTFIKLIFLLTIFIGYIILSAKSKSMTSRRNNCGCGEINSPHRIVGGKFTNPHAYPWQALIRNRYANGSSINICGGTVINNRYILSAAHCVYLIEGKLEVALGVHDFYQRFPFYFKVVKIIVHENYNPVQPSCDIAIFKVNGWIKFNRIVKPICLPNQNEQFYGKIATVIGWGDTKENGSMSHILKEATVKVLERTCLGHTPDLYKNTSWICAYGGRDGVCNGDSGGSLFYTNENGKAVQIGIASWLNDVCASLPTFYTKISTFLDWIHKNTKDATYCKRKM